MASLLVPMALLCFSLPALAVTSGAASLIQVPGTNLCLDVHGIPVSLQTCQPGSPDQMFVIVNSSIIQQSSGKCLFSNTPTCPHYDWTYACCEHVDWLGGCTHWATTLSIGYFCSIQGGYAKFAFFKSSAGAIVQGVGDLSKSSGAPSFARQQYLTRTDGNMVAGTPVILYSEDQKHLWSLPASTQSSDKSQDDEAVQRLAPVVGLLV